ncbi:MAG: hypothetical protein ABMB14_17050 [Myxococcota bacterium]
MWWIATVGCVQDTRVGQALTLSGDYEVASIEAFTSNPDRSGHDLLPGSEPVVRVTPRGDRWTVSPSEPPDVFATFSLDAEVDPPLLALADCGERCATIANIDYSAPVRLSGILREDFGGFWYTPSARLCTAGVAWTEVDPAPVDGDVKISLWTAVVTEDLPAQTDDDCFGPELSRVALLQRPDVTWDVLVLEEIVGWRQ